MNALANVTRRVYSRLPFNTLRKMTKKKLLVLAYHLVSDADVPHAKHLYRYRNVEQFTTEMDFFLSHYAPMGMRDLLECLNSGKPIERDSFLLTFDDGLREMHDVVAPLLKRKGVTATFFLTTDFLDNKKLAYFCKISLALEALSQCPGRADAVAGVLREAGIDASDVARALRQIRHDQQDVLDAVAPVLELDFDEYRKNRRPFLNTEEVNALLRDGFTIGAHSVDHPLYALLSLQEQLRQTTQSVRFLQQRFALDYKVFAFPHHDYGVSRTYFEEVFGNHLVDASFGTAALMDDVFPRSFQRLGMETKWMPTRARLREEYVDYLMLARHDRHVMPRLN